jgi:CRP/FNR family transcriptional regulator, anaerobic regulatory protein
MYTSTAISCPRTDVLPGQAASALARASHLRAHVVADCTACHLREVCLPGDLDEADVRLLHGLVVANRRVRRGDCLVRAGDKLEMLYLVKAGVFKSFVVGDSGDTQVTAFPMQGDLVGLDALDTGTHHTSIVALEDSDTCAISYSDFERVARSSAAVQRRFMRLMSHQLVEEQRMMLLLGTMRGEQRLSMFLMELSKRYQRLRYSPTEFVLRMTREDIGSFLGLKLETVSRLFSRFQQAGLIKIDQRSLKLLDIEALRQLSTQ